MSQEQTQIANSYYGAHMSIKRSIVSAVDEMREMGGNMIQIFISNPMSNQNVDKTKYNQIQSNLIKKKLAETNTKLVIHLPYVINLAKMYNPDSQTIKSICNQLDVSENIGSIGCVVHVGKYLELTESDGLDNMYLNLKAIVNYLNTNNFKTKIILETSAGQGTELLSTKNNDLSELSNFYNRFDNVEKEHIKICVDTCHIFAAGYDIRTKKRVNRFFNDFNDQIGIKHIALIHLNDSKKGCGCCVDRHANLGLGEIGIVGLRQVIKYCVYYSIPIILETPDDHQNEIKLISEVKNNVEEWARQKTNT